MVSSNANNLCKNVDPVRGIPTINIGDDFTQTTYKTQIEATDQNVLRLVTDSDDANGVELVLRKDSASPADEDNIGNIYFQGNDDAGSPNEIQFGSIISTAANVAENSWSGKLEIKVATSNA